MAAVLAPTTGPRGWCWGRSYTEAPELHVALFSAAFLISCKRAKQCVRVLCHPWVPLTVQGVWPHPRPLPSLTASFWGTVAAGRRSCDQPAAGKISVAIAGFQASGQARMGWKVWQDSPSGVT